MRNKCLVKRRLAIIKIRNPPIIFGRIALLTVKKMHVLAQLPYNSG
jgi:hypothetical protein